MKHAKQIIVGLVTVAAVALLLTPARHPEVIPTGRTLVRYWGYWTGVEADAMQEIIDSFNDTIGKDKGIWVQYISISQSDQKTLTATAAGVPPDIAGVMGDQLAQFAAMNAIEPLEKMAAEHGITREYYKPVYWDACSFEGHLYAMVATPFVVGLYWNKQIFQDRAEQLRAAGLDPDRPPATLAELDRYAQALEVWKDGHLEAGGFFEQQPGWWREHLYDWFGGRIFDEKTGRLTLDSPNVIQAYDWMQSYSKRIGPAEVSRFASGLPDVNTFDTPLQPFVTGALAMMKQGPWLANSIEHLRPAMNRWKMSKQEESKLPREQRKQNYMWGAAPFPSAVPGEKNAGFAGVDILVIPSTARHKAEAFEFIAFVNRQDNMEKLCSLHCKNSPLAKMSGSYLANHRNPYIEVFEELAASPHVHPVPPVPIWPQIQSELRNIAGIIVQDVGPQSSPAHLLAEAQVRYQAELDRFNARRAERRARGLLQ
ncbi:MAG TPA: extracellular solute-binding protein [Tepidisphaeraceae bacterium]|nr:extracellular solute-binding protein [Tepidisphaeraceae bacterium]